MSLTQRCKNQEHTMSAHRNIDKIVKYEELHRRVICTSKTHFDVQTQYKLAILMCSAVGESKKLSVIIKQAKLW